MFLCGDWRSRAAHAPFFSLGLAAYLDCHAGACAYRNRELRQLNNDLLRLHFGSLLEEVAAAIATVVGEAVHFAEDEAALPGFHIYLPHPTFGAQIASVHRDFQYRDAFPNCHADDTLSFTLPLSVPAGSGLNVWDTDGKVAFHGYTKGHLVLHDGLTLHQAVLNCVGNTERITLQGHAVRRSGKLMLYW
jgi:hypothetical protein